MKINIIDLNWFFGIFMERAVTWLLFSRNSYSGSVFLFRVRPFHTHTHTKTSGRGITTCRATNRHPPAKTRVCAALDVRESDACLG